MHLKSMHLTLTCLETCEETFLQLVDVFFFLKTIRSFRVCVRGFFIPKFYQDIHIVNKEKKLEQDHEWKRRNKVKILLCIRRIRN